MLLPPEAPKRLCLILKDDNKHEGWAQLKATCHILLPSRGLNQTWASDLAQANERVTPGLLLSMPSPILTDLIFVKAFLQARTPSTPLT